MTPQARVQAAIELLDEIVAAARDAGPAADTLIARYFKARRYAGSGDRRAVRALVYAAIRRAGERPVSGRAALVGLADDDPTLPPLFDGSAHGPAAIEAGEPHSAAKAVPGWLEEPLAETLDADGIAGLLGRAPLDLRVNRLKSSRDALLPEIVGAEATPHSPVGLRLPAGTAVETLPAFLGGAFEVQDEGSQLVALAAGAAPGMTVVDLCAGGGGKTLALAAEMGDRGRIVAADTDRGRLSRLGPRAARAGVTIVNATLLDPGREAEALIGLVATADLVLIDAPCSGTGTWRRNPEARWRLTPARLEQLIDLQARLLELGSTFVRPGGVLVHIVCSLLDAEGAGQVARFLDAHPDWLAEPIALPAGRAHRGGILLSPASDGTDGFFVARLRAPC